MIMKHISRIRAGIAAAMVFAVSACSDGPTQVEFQVIEEVDFAASLDVDLATMTKLGSGVYYKDLLVGDGETVIIASRVNATYDAWLTDGTHVISTTYEFVIGNQQVPIGLEGGVFNQREGGVRQIIIPPHVGYGGIAYIGLDGAEIPPGSVLIYEVTVNDVS
jgi:FKBP-type peptidyl-prolyl cis-trans isomerase